MKQQTVSQFEGLSQEIFSKMKRNAEKSISKNWKKKVTYLSVLQQGTERSEYMVTYGSRLRVGRSQLISTKLSVSDFRDAVETQLVGMEPNIYEIANAMLRYAIFSRSQLKASTISSVSSSDRIGEELKKPDSEISISDVLYFSEVLTSKYGVKPFVRSGKEKMKFIGSPEVIDKLKGKDSGSIEFLNDYLPLRMRMTRYGLRFIEPTVFEKTESGIVATPNNAWCDSKYELGFLCGEGSFELLKPPSCIGGVGVDFQLHELTPDDEMTEEEKKNARDKCVILYRYFQNLKTLNPNAVLPIIFKRRK